MAKRPTTEHGKRLLDELAESIWRCELIGKTAAGTVMPAEEVEDCDQAARAGELRVSLSKFRPGVISVTKVSKPDKTDAPQ